MKIQEDLIRFKKNEEQEAVQSRAAWELMGAQTSQLWLLDDKELRDMAAEAGAIVSDTALDKEHLINVLVRRQNQQLVTNNNGADSSARASPETTSNNRFRVESVPQNLQALSLKELRSICAAHGVLPAGPTKADIIQQIEDDLCAEEITPQNSRKKSKIRHLK